LWLLLLWSWSNLAEIHLAEYVYEKGCKMIEIAHAHPYPLLFIAVGLILLVAIWPEIKHLFPSLPPTAHQRMHSAEASVKDHGERLSGLESQWKNAKLTEVVPALDDRIRVLTGVTQKVGSAASWLGDMAVLIAEAHHSHETLKAIIKYHPQSEVALRPLSRMWRPYVGTPIPDEATGRGVVWIGHLEQHMAHCRLLETDVKIQLVSGQTERLFAYLDAVDSPDMSGTDCLSMLAAHEAHLRQVRSTKAANLADATLNFDKLTPA
jgi:hypothetical protein